eukprot:Pgem_evm1s2346
MTIMLTVTGGHERGIRSGTLPTQLIVGLGAACDLASKEMDYDHKRITAMSQRLINGIQSKVPEIIHNGDSEK